PAEILPPQDLRIELPPLGRFGFERPLDPRLYEASDWEKISTVLSKHRKLVAGFAFTTFLTVGIVTFMIKPMYEPATRVEIDPPGTEIFSLQGDQAGYDASEYLQTQAQKLKSDELALEVIRALRLDHNDDLVPQKAMTTIAEASVREGAGQLTPAENRALQTFRERAAVTRDSGSRLVTVSFGSHDPRLAALVTNNILEPSIHQSFPTR